MSIAVEGVSRLCLFAVLFLLGGANYLKAFETNQLQALAYLSLRLYNHGFAISLVLFGCCLFLYGYLIFRSGYFPKFLGALVAIGALCYPINSFVLFLAPQYADKTFSLLLLSFIAELSLCLWLIVMGVNLKKWEERASLSRG